MSLDFRSLWAAALPYHEFVAASTEHRGLWEGLAIGEMFARSARRAPDRIAVVHGERRLTYAELLAAARVLAARLAGIGLRPRERVLVQLPNTIDFVVAYLALNVLGAIPVMALRAHRHAEVRHFLRASGADLLTLRRERNEFFRRLHHGVSDFTLLRGFRCREPAPSRARRQRLPGELIVRLR